MRERLMHSHRGTIETMIDDEADEVAENFFESFKNRN